MEIVNQISRNKLLAFVLGTLVIQGAMFFTALGFHYRTIPVTSEVAVSDVNAPQEAIPSDSSEVASVSESVELQNSESSQKLEAPAAPKSEPLSYKISKGDNLSVIWQKHGGTYAGSLKAAQAFKDAGVSIGSLRLGETVQITVVDGDIVEFQKKLAKGKTLILQGNSTDGYSSRIVEQGHLDQERVVVGTVDSSFALATARRDVPYDVVDEFVDLFSSRVEFRRDFQVGDEFTLVFSERRLDNGELVSAGPITAASLKLRGKMLAVVRYVGEDGKAYYFDEGGNLIGNYFLRYPVVFSRISSVFTDSRLHPVLGFRRPHLGVDFAAPTGTPVRAVADGRVVAAGYNGEAGNMIKIAHNGRYATAYMHLSRLSPGIRNGAVVSKGQIIGAVGMTGLATGPHLHFALFDRGAYVNPLKANLPVITLDKKNTISPSYLRVAVETLKRYHESAQVAANIKNTTAVPPA